MSYFVRFLLVAMFLCADPAWAQNTWDGAGNLNVNTGGRGGTPGGVTPGPLTLVPLDISTVTTGGTAYTALNAGHRNKGGWIANPINATIPLCINEIGTASGTASAGNTTCVSPGITYGLAPSGNAVSVISADSAHPFSGLGFN